MSARITRDVLESYVLCKYKSHLKLTEQQGTKSDYESLYKVMSGKIRLKAIDKILAQHQENVVSSILLTTSALKRGSLFILDATIEDDLICLCFDGLKKVSGPSELGGFHYVPMLFHGGHQVRKEQKLLLELYGQLLSQYQGISPKSGIIWHGRECKVTKVHLKYDLRKIEQVFLDLKEMCSVEATPKLILNEHCQVCEFRQRCRDQAVQEDNISLLRGMSEKEIKSHTRKGIFTVTQLAHTFRPRRRGKRAGQETKRHHHALQALAIRDKRVYVLGTPEIPNSPVCIYFDVESNPEEGFVYLISSIVVENGLEKSYSFWADHKEQESKIFEQFVAEVTRHKNFLVFCYGNYERAFLMRMRKVAKSKKRVDKILNALGNTLSLIYAHIYFPTYSNSLKDIAKCVGYSWTESDASGIQSIVWRMQWEATHNDALKQKLTMYNLEDCTALKRVTELLQIIIAKANSEEPSLLEEREHPPIALVKDVEKLTDYYKWGRVSFVNPDYEYVNNCAYFDYQRERVYVRTSKNLRKNKARRKLYSHLKLKASKQLVIVASRCPACKSKEVISGVKKQVRNQEPRVKRAFDLVLTQGGIRRRVIECRTSVHKCLECSTEFIPYQHHRLDKHFHCLKSWAMFQHVAYRISLATLPKIFDEFFGLRIHRSEIHMFKSLMAGYYKVTYQKLLQKMIAGTLLHVDETEVKLQNRKGYVWVFTNLEEVVYMYRPTREGDFLRNLLKNFRGVLVSDFYTVYDAIECPQQKCLIHLIRDINQELLSNPFDEDLKLITQPFGSMLRRIITTVDEHGLRRKYLKQHEVEIEKYFKFISEQTIRSEIAESLRVRMTKYRDKLFTFINYNGVPWNNNNAEHAIKQFANFRENNVGTMRETGLNDYLVLLSIYQTCRYKGVSFLKFLLSKERDIEAFGKGKKRVRRFSSIELYPKDFVFPHRAISHNQRLNQKRNAIRKPNK